MLTTHGACGKSWKQDLGMREWMRPPAMLQWAARRYTAVDHARSALPWVKSQVLSAYQEGFAAADQIEGAL